MPFKQSDSNHTEKPIFFSFFLLRKSSTWFNSHIDRASFFLALLEAWKKSYLFFSRLFNIIPTWRPKSVQTRFRQFMDAHKKYTSTTFFLFLPFDSQRYACLLEMSICPTVDIPSVFLGWKPKKTEGTKFEKKQDTGCRHCTETLSRGHALSRFNLKKEDAQPPPPHFDTEK